MKLFGYLCILLRHLHVSVIPVTIFRVLHSMNTRCTTFYHSRKKVLRNIMLLLKWTEYWRILLCILCDLFCASGIYTVEHPVDGHRNYRNI
jgi:hypothetical protein